MDAAAKGQPPLDSKTALPAWAQALREKYLAGEAPTFVLYRNGFDIYLLAGQPDAAERAKRFAGITAGMTADDIVKLVKPTRTLPTPDLVEDVLRLIQARKRELIGKECAGLIEFVDHTHGLSAVGGCAHITREPMDIARALRGGDSKLTPMGLLAVGPMGAGKTFVIKAFLKEAGLSAVALKNFRFKWVGATEEPGAGAGHGQGHGPDRGADRRGRPQLRQRGR